MLIDAFLAATCVLMVAAVAAVVTAERSPRLGRPRAGGYARLVIIGSVACISSLVLAVAIDAPRPGSAAALASVGLP